MPRTVMVAPHRSVDDVARRYREARDSIERRHWRLVWLVAQGHRVSEGAQVVGDTPNWGRAIIRRDNAEGPAGLMDHRHHNPGRASLLTPALRAELRTALDGLAPDGGAWTSAKVAAWIAIQLGRPVAPARGWETLRALGFTPHRFR